MKNKQKQFRFKWTTGLLIPILFVGWSFVLLSPIIIGKGLPFSQDWVWHIFDMKQFWSGLVENSSFGLFSALSKNGPAVFGLFELIHFPSSIFLKLFIVSVHFVAGYGFYRFIKRRIKSEAIAIVSGLVYAFSPYIFIRTIIGFTWSMVAYAALPIFLLKFWQTNKKILDFLIIGFLLSLIFSQTQTGLLSSLIITVYLIINLFGRNKLIAVKNYFFTYSSLLLFALPWLIVILAKKNNMTVVSGGAVTTLNFIASLPHSFRNIFMLSDHHITAGFFYPLAHNKLFLLGWMIVWFVAFCALFNKKNRELVWTFVISSLIVLPFIKGPVGIFGKFYIWFYNHFPQIAVFRETYHFEFLYAVSLCVLFAFGLDWLWERIEKIKLSVISYRLSVSLKTGLKTLFAGSAIFIIAPYLTFDYAGYFHLQKIPQSYYDLNDYFQKNKDICRKIYYPPGLGFIYFKNDKTFGASNSDILASSLGVSYLTDGTSVLNLPSEEMFYRNELVSQFYEKEKDRGEFSSLMREGSIDCVVLRLDTETRYPTSSNLWREKSPAIVKKWNNMDLKTVVESKKGLKLEKQFGENIYIYKSEIRNPKSETNSNFQNSKLEKTDKPSNQQFSNSAIQQLPLSDWANVNSYYKDGWSRGRYDFWRKHLFTQIRQDFIYTDRSDSVLSGKIDYKGDYGLWIRYLIGGTSGELEIKIPATSAGGQDTRYKIQKDRGEERFIWKKLGDIKLDGKTDIEIKNISGENAIADLVIVRK